MIFIETFLKIVNEITKKGGVSDDSKEFTLVLYTLSLTKDKFENSFCFIFFLLKNFI